MENGILTNNITDSLINEIIFVSRNYLDNLPLKNNALNWLIRLNQACNRRGGKTDETLASFVLKLVFQDPQNHYSEDEALDDSRVEELIDKCVHRILNDKGPVMETARMQVFFSNFFQI